MTLHFYCSMLSSEDYTGRYVWLKLKNAAASGNIRIEK